MIRCVQVRRFRPPSPSACAASASRRPTTSRRRRSSRWRSESASTGFSNNPATASSNERAQRARGLHGAQHRERARDRIQNRREPFGVGRDVEVELAHEITEIVEHVVNGARQTREVFAVDRRRQGRRERARQVGSLPIAAGFQFVDFVLHVVPVPAPALHQFEDAVNGVDLFQHLRDGVLVRATKNLAHESADAPRHDPSLT